MEYHTLRVAGVLRRLPRVAVSDALEIASFVMLGDTELIERSAKAIPLAHALAKLTQVNYIVARKSVKAYMHEPIVERVRSITTTEEQLLVLDGPDVVSTDGSIVSLQKLFERSGCNVIAKVAVFLEEGGYCGDDLSYLKRLPVFSRSERAAGHNR